MNLRQYLKESNRETDLLKKLNQWKSDLRKMTKLYKSIPAEDTPQALKLFKQAHIYWTTFRQNWEKWYNIELIKRGDDAFGSDIPKEEKDRVERVKVAAWQAEMSLNSLFPTEYSYKIGKDVDAPWMLDKPKYSKGDTRKNRILVYQRKFKEAFDAIEDLIKHQAETLNVVKATERVNVQGINVLISGLKDNEKKDSFNMRITKNFIQKSLPAALKLIKREGIKQILRGLTIEVVLSGAKSVGVQSGAGGSYDYIKDWLRMYPMGMGSDSVPTIVHELGHRYYFKHLSDSAVRAWEYNFHKQSLEIKDRHIETFFKKYGELGEFDTFNKKKVIADIKKNETDPNIQTIYTYLANNFPGWGYKKEGDRNEVTRARLKEYNSGQYIATEFVTEYARTNPAEAFAEVFKLWVTGNKGRLGEWTRTFFKEVVRSGGANIREENEMDLVYKYLEDNIRR